MRVSGSSDMASGLIPPLVQRGTLEYVYALPCAGDAANATPITDISN